MLTLLFERRGSLVLVVHTAKDPSPEDWSAYLDVTVDAMAENQGRCRALVFTAGGKPDATQRALAVERGWKQNRLSPVAVVSDDRLVRGVITVFAWFGVNIRATRPDRLDVAFEHLELTSEEQAWAIGTRERLEEELGMARSVRSVRRAS